MLKTTKSRFIVVGLSLGVLFLVWFVIQAIRIIPIANQARYMSQVDEYSDNPQAAQAALATNPNDAAANEGLAQANVKGRNNNGHRNWPEAIKYFRETVRIQPQNSGAWVMLAVSLRSNGQKAEAIEIFKKLVDDKVYGDSVRKTLAKWQSAPTP